MSQVSAKSYLKANLTVIAAGVASLVVVDILQLLIPRVTKHAIDDLAYLSIDSRQLLRYALIILGMGVIIGGFRYVWRRCLIGTSRKIEKDLRQRLFAHVQTLDAAYFDHTSTGDLMARATNDINNIRMATGFGLVALTDAVFLGTAAIGFMAYINVRLTLYSLIPMPLVVIVTKIMSRRMHKKYQGVQASFSHMTETVRERFAGIRVIKAFARQDDSTRAFSESSREYIRQNLNLIKITGTFFPLMVFFTNASTAIVLYLGGHQTITAEITPGDFVAFISYLALLTWPMMALGWVTTLIQRGRASLDRINQVLAASPDVQEDPRARPIKEFTNSLDWEEATFTYPGSPAPSLESIDLDLPAGQTLCLLGPPGSGKTTLAKLMARRYDPDTGRIRLDGMDLRSLKIESLRSLMAYMPQEPFLFSTTIRENITFDSSVGDDDERLIKACRQAGLYETIGSLPRGFETITGEKGVVLSGGQKQRVVLARTFYHQAPLIILDDPVSQVDTETADNILRELTDIAAGRTLIFISHRLFTARFADRVMVLRQGRVAEYGSHQELLRADGYYASIWRLQEVEES
ncbi:MAG: ABC transporter ATP-binding protein [Desulfosudaceae bacterium]